MIDFHAIYSDELIGDASREVARQSSKPFSPLVFYVAIVINFVGFTLLLVFSQHSLFVWIFGFLVIGSSLYWIVARPLLIRAILRRYHQSSAQISLTPEAVTVASKGRVLTLRWTNVKEVLELRDYFLVMIGRIIAIVVPKEGLPTVGSDLLRAVGNRIKPKSLTEVLFP